MQPEQVGGQGHGRGVWSAGATCAGPRPCAPFDLHAHLNISNLHIYQDWLFPAMLVVSNQMVVCAGDETLVPLSVAVTFLDSHPAHFQRMI